MMSSKHVPTHVLTLAPLFAVEKTRGWQVPRTTRTRRRRRTTTKWFL